MTQLIDHQAAVGVAVERHTDVVLPRHDALTEAFQMRRAAMVVDVRAVRLAVNEVHIALEAAEQLRRGGAGRAVRAVHQNTQTGEVGVDGGDKMMDILLLALLQTVVQHADLAAGRNGNGLAGEDLRLDLRLRRVGKFVSLFVEHLDAVVFKGIVARGDDDARVRALENGQVRDRRSRQHAEGHHVAADGADAADERGFEHIGGNARVLADGDEGRSPLLLLQNGGDGLTGVERQLDGQILAHDSADAVGAK